MQNITSEANPRIKNAEKLVRSSRHRKKEGAFVLEGLRLCMEIPGSGYNIEELFVTQSAQNKDPDKISKLCECADKVYIITDQISKKLSDTKTAQGIFCVCGVLDREKRSNTIDAQGRYILLEGIADPSNLGAICRTAHALGITGVLISGGVDIYSPKVQRASMGSMLKIPVIQIDEIRQFIEELKLKKMRVYASTPNDGALDINKADFKNGTVCVIGNEANGVSESTQDICDGLITVKMKGKAESLNASSAASIIMWEMMR